MTENKYRGLDYKNHDNPVVRSALKEARNEIAERLRYLRKKDPELARAYHKSIVDSRHKEASNLWRNNSFTNSFIIGD